MLTASFYEPGGETILVINEELSVRIVLFVPLVISGLVWLALHIACRNDNRAARSLGVAAACILLVFAILTGFTIGIFVLPGAIALTAAAALTPSGHGPPHALNAERPRTILYRDAEPTPGATAFA